MLKVAEPVDKPKTPLKAMILHPTVWIVMLCDFANIWGILVMINEGPNFIDKVLHQNISTVRNWMKKPNL